MMGMFVGWPAKIAGLLAGVAAVLAAVTAALSGARRQGQRDAELASARKAATNSGIKQDEDRKVADLGDDAVARELREQWSRRE